MSRFGSRCGFSEPRGRARRRQQLRCGRSCPNAVATLLSSSSSSFGGQPRQDVALRASCLVADVLGEAMALSANDFVLETFGDEETSEDLVFLHDVADEETMSAAGDLTEAALWNAMPMSPSCSLDVHASAVDEAAEVMSASSQDEESDEDVDVEEVGLMHISVGLAKRMLFTVSQDEEQDEAPPDATEQVGEEVSYETLQSEWACDYMGSLLDEALESAVKCGARKPEVPAGQMRGEIQEEWCSTFIGQVLGEATATSAARRARAEMEQQETAARRSWALGLTTCLLDGALSGVADGFAPAADALLPAPSGLAPCERRHFKRALCSGAPPAPEPFPADCLPSEALQVPEPLLAIDWQLVLSAMTVSAQPSKQVRRSCSRSCRLPRDEAEGQPDLESEEKQLPAAGESAKPSRAKRSVYGAVTREPTPRSLWESAPPAPPRQKCPSKCARPPTMPGADQRRPRRAKEIGGPFADPCTTFAPPPKSPAPAWKAPAAMDLDLEVARPRAASPRSSSLSAMDSFRAEKMGSSGMTKGNKASLLPLLPGTQRSPDQIAWSVSMSKGRLGRSVSGSPDASLRWMLK